MTWRDKWQTGSFRGAGFKWRQSDAVVGRKTARHDYPLRDEAYIEDLGKRPREFTLDCFVIGVDYTDQRDALIDALEKEGPGTLIHPTMGAMQVSVHGDVRITESTAEGGMCRFSIPFVLAGEKNYPAQVADTSSLVDEKSDTAIGKIEDAFAGKFSCRGVLQFVADDAKSLTEAICDTLDGLAKSFPTTVETPAFLKDLAKIRNSVAALVNEPLLLARSITGRFYGLRNLALAPLDLVDSVKSTLTATFQGTSKVPKDLFNAHARQFDYGNASGSASSTPATPSRIRQEGNREALNTLMRQTAVVEAARASSIIEYTSYDEAAEVRDRLMDAIDAELSSASDEVFAGLLDVRSAVLADIDTRGADLSRIARIAQPRTEPALVVAHRLYGDATRAEEIVARNGIAHPLFVPGGRVLEVLND